MVTPVTPAPASSQAPQPEPAEIDEVEIPLAPTQGQGVWSLLNLISAIASAISIAIVFVHWLRTRNTRDEENTEDDENAQQESAPRGKLVLRAILAVTGLATIVLVILFENFRLPMDIVN